MATSSHITEMDKSHNIALPVEVIEHIADFLFELKSPAPDCAGNTPIIHSKPPWTDIRGFMGAGVDFHQIGFARWLRVITIVSASDWDVVLQHPWFVREIQCLEHALSNRAHQYVLAQLPNLYAARIDTHSSVSLDHDNLFMYSDVFTSLPPSLRRLEVVNAHGPDIKIIATVKKHCPQLEALRLGRCTMFNRIPPCDFWRSFPQDHDAYISVNGTDTYAHLLGAALSPLKNLRSLRIGIYLVPSNIVLAHRLYHRYGRVAPGSIDWQTAIPLSEFPITSPDVPENLRPATTDQLISLLHQQDSELGFSFDCQQCVNTTANIGIMAEMTANGILQRHVPSLHMIEWMGCLTPGHLGVYGYHISVNSTA